MGHTQIAGEVHGSHRPSLATQIQDHLRVIFGGLPGVVLADPLETASGSDFLALPPIRATVSSFLIFG